MFLDDSDPSLVDEAIRAINDLDIPDALPALTEFSDQFAGEFDGPTPEDIMFRRLINANFRLGTPESAARLVSFGSNARLPSPLRALALRAVELFPFPPSVDPTLGIYRPLPTRDKGPIRELIEAPLVDIFKNSTGDVVAAATRAIGTYGISLDTELLQSRIRDGRQPVEVRQTAMAQLFSDKSFSDKQLLKTIIDGYEPEMASEAARIWVDRYPKEVLEPVDMLLAHEEDISKRTAYTLLAADEGDGSAAVLVAELEKLIAGDLYRTVHLDLYEAASNRHDATIKKALASVDKYLATIIAPFSISPAKVVTQTKVAMFSRIRASA